MMNQQMNCQAQKKNCQVQSRDLSVVNENLKRILSDIEECKAKYRKPEDDIRIMAVTKTVEPQTVNFVVENGITLLGENRVQEYLEKKDIYLPDVEVHFIGHLQTNKVKYIIDKVNMIQSVDSVKLADEINRLAIKNNIVMPILIEVNAGDELSKSGVAAENAFELCEYCSELKGISVNGLMAIPPIGADERIYEKMYSLYLDIKDKKVDNINMNVLSIGMSGDYATAIKYGSNLVRIGSKLFGARKYMEVK